MQNEYLVHHEPDSQCNELFHYGTKEMKWYHRRYQNYDGSLTPLGRIHYGVGEKRERKKQEAAAAVAKREEAMKHKPLSEKQQRVEQLAKDDREEEFRRQENVEKSEEKRYRDVRSMSDDEIAAFKKRLQSEKDLINLQNDLAKLANDAKPWYVKTVKKMAKSYVDSLSDTIVTNGVKATADFLGLDFNPKGNNNDQKKAPKNKSGDLNKNGDKNQYTQKKQQDNKQNSNKDDPGKDAGNAFVDPKALPKGTIFKTRTVAKTPEGTRYVYTGTGTGPRSKVKTSNSGGQGVKISDAQIAEIKSLVNKVSYDEIASRVGVSRDTVSKYAQEKKRK